MCSSNAIKIPTGSKRVGKGFGRFTVCFIVKLRRLQGLERMKSQMCSDVFTFKEFKVQIFFFSQDVKIWSVT